MRTIFSILLILFFAGNVYPQALSQVVFSGHSTLSSFSFLTDQGVLIRISADGKILEYGIEVKADRFEYYAPRLQPFMGRVDYFGPESDSAFRGKIKNIGTCFFTYYGPYEMAAKAGKIKTIGSVLLDYFSEYENEILRGKLRTAGSFLIDYYQSFENEAYRGKLKLVGSTVITYYSTFDDKAIRGKIKSIGSFAYKWPTSYTGRTYRNEMTPGWQRRYINGVTYVVN